jgi:hypothetical protein
VGRAATARPVSAPPVMERGRSRGQEVAIGAGGRDGEILARIKQ